MFTTGLTEVFLTAKQALGTLRWEGNKCYKYVKLYNDTGTVAGVNGDQLLYAAETGHSTNTVVLDGNDADTVVVGAGICLATVTGTVDTAYYIWMQIKGPCTLSTQVSGSPDDGQPIMATSTDKTFGLAVDVDGGGDSLSVCGILTDDSAKLCALDCPF